MERSTLGTVVTLIGLFVGLTFGTLAMLTGAWNALAVLACGVVGALLAWTINGVVTGTLDPAGAWRALLRK